VGECKTLPATKKFSALPPMYMAPAMPHAQKKATARQGLTLVHFSAQLKHYL